MISALIVFKRACLILIKNISDLTTYELLGGDAKKLDNTKFTAIKGNIADYLLDSNIKIPYNQNITAMRNAMGQISTLSTVELEKNLCDFIDLCSYRLDAWQTGLFTRRALTNRNAVAAGFILAPMD